MEKCIAVGKRPAYFGHLVKARWLSGRASALTDETLRAGALEVDLGKRFSDDTIAQFKYLPTLRSQLALNNYDSGKAIEVFQAAMPRRAKLSNLARPTMFFLPYGRM